MTNLQSSLVILSKKKSLQQYNVCPVNVQSTCLPEGLAGGGSCQSSDVMSPQGWEASRSTEDSGLALSRYKQGSI